MIVHQRFQGSGGLSCNTQVNTTNFKDPRIKNPGVFCFPQGRMTDKKIKEAEWVAKHTLTEEQFKQLIQNKMNRAALYHRAVINKQESRLNAN